jgi:hypothetical protein
MDWQNPEYQEIARQIPELAAGNPKIKAHFTLVAEIDQAATEATGKLMDEVLEPASEANGWTPLVRKAEATGYTVFRDVLYIEEHIIGDKDFVSTPATEAHREKYPEAWARFTAWQRSGLHPVTAVHGITPAAIETFRGLGIGSMEKLAAHEAPLPVQFERHRQFARRFLGVVNGKKERYRLVEGKPVLIEETT